MKTRTIKQSERKAKKYIIDAKGVRMGKLVSKIAELLLGKHEVSAVRYIPTVDDVYIVNAKMMDYHPTKSDKLYYRHSMYPGGLKSETLESMIEKKPEKLLKISVWGMLPKNRFGRMCLKGLKVMEDGQTEVIDAEKIVIK